MPAICTVHPGMLDFAAVLRSSMRSARPRCPRDEHQIAAQCQHAAIGEILFFAGFLLRWVIVQADELMRA